LIKEYKVYIYSWGWGVLGKMLLTKKALRKSHIQEQSLMAGSNCQDGWGKMAQHRFWARRGFYRRRRLRR
jgi:hypothetical protein